MPWAKKEGGAENNHSDPETRGYPQQRIRKRQLPSILILDAVGRVPASPKSTDEMSRRRNKEANSDEGPDPEYLGGGIQPGEHEVRLRYNKHLS
jgi:hypothetical protein